MHMLSPDSKFMQGLSDTVDAIWINILMLVTSIPVITIGAAVTAGYEASRRVVRGEAHVTRNYFRAFGSNFVKATLLWLPFLVVGVTVAAVWLDPYGVFRAPAVLVAKFAATIVWVIGFEWVFVLQARFENSVGRTLGNAFVFGVVRFGYTAAVAAIDAAFVALVAVSVFHFMGGLPLLLVFGYGTMLMLHVPIMERAIKPYIGIASANRPEAQTEA